MYASYRIWRIPASTNDIPINYALAPPVPPFLVVPTLHKVELVVVWQVHRVVWADHHYVLVELAEDDLACPAGDARVA